MVKPSCPEVAGARRRGVGPAQGLTPPVRLHRLMQRLLGSIAALAADAEHGVAAVVVEVLDPRGEASVIRSPLSTNSVTSASARGEWARAAASCAWAGERWRLPSRRSAGALIGSVSSDLEIGPCARESDDRLP